METSGQRAAGIIKGPVEFAAYALIGLYVVTRLTALFGTPEQSERALRIMSLDKDKLDWLRRLQESAPPDPAPSARGRARQGGR